MGTATKTLERPILFTGPMVRAILRDVDPKTVTRRVVKWPEWVVDHEAGAYWLNRNPCIALHRDGRPVLRFCCPYGQPGNMKRGPINKLLRRLGPLVISVEGVRAQESRARARKPCWEPRTAISNSRREALTWRPIHRWTEDQVWESLGSSSADLDRRRSLYRLGAHDLALDGWSAHPAYVRGNERLSCSICVLGSAADIANGARHNPAYFAELVALEREYGWAFREGFSLVDLSEALG